MPCVSLQCFIILNFSQKLNHFSNPDHTLDIEWIYNQNENKYGMNT